MRRNAVRMSTGGAVKGVRPGITKARGQSPSTRAPRVTLQIGAKGHLWWVHRATVADCCAAARQPSSTRCKIPT